MFAFLCTPSTQEGQQAWNSHSHVGSDCLQLAIINVNGILDLHICMLLYFINYVFVCVCVYCVCTCVCVLCVCVCVCCVCVCVVYMVCVSVWCGYKCVFSYIFLLLFYVGTHLARGYSSRDPWNHYNTHTHIQLHTTQSQAITSNHKQSSLIIHAHCVVSGSTFVLVIHSGVQGWV